MSCPRNDSFATKLPVMRACCNPDTCDVHPRPIPPCDPGSPPIARRRAIETLRSTEARVTTPAHLHAMTPSPRKQAARTTCAATPHTPLGTRVPLFERHKFLGAFSRCACQSSGAFQGAEFCLEQLLETIGPADGTPEGVGVLLSYIARPISYRGTSLIRNGTPP